MTECTFQNKENTYGGLAQIAIFGIITAITTALNIGLDVTSGVLNTIHNKKQMAARQEPQTFNSYQPYSKITIF